MSRPTSTCSVEGCENPVGRTGGQGLCCKHYKRKRAHGDPLAGGTSKGDVKRFLDWAAAQRRDECIIFPFYRNEAGYGWFKPPGQKQSIGAHVYVAELVHGAKPTPKHESCHECGNGHLGCVTGGHVYWGTRKENVQDAISHGTAKLWGVPRDMYAEFRRISAEVMRPLKDSMVGGWRTAANDNEPQRSVA